MGGIVVDSVDEQELDRLVDAIAQQLKAGYAKARKCSRKRSGFQIVIHIQPGHEQAYIQWPPETTGVGISRKTK